MFKWVLNTTLHVFHTYFFAFTIFSLCFTEPFSKRCDIWCQKRYTDKNEKQVGCYVDLHGVETFSDI